MTSVRKRSGSRSSRATRVTKETSEVASRARHHSEVYRDSSKSRRKVGDAAYTLMSPSLGLDPTLEYARAESLVDALVDLYGVIEGEWPRELSGRGETP